MVASLLAEVVYLLNQDLGRAGLANEAEENRNDGKSDGIYIKQPSPTCRQ